MIHGDQKGSDLVVTAMSDLATTEPVLLQGMPSSMVLNMIVLDQIDGDPR